MTSYTSAPRKHTAETAQTMVDVRYEVDRLDRVLVEILAERQVLKTTETPATESPLGEAQQSVAINSQTGSNQAQPDFRGDSGGFQVNAQPIPSQKGTNPIPDDIPDARDDDIIARQLIFCNNCISPIS